MTLPRLVLITLFLTPFDASAQTSSLGARRREEHQGAVPVRLSREVPINTRNVTIDRYSWITLTPTAPKTFKVNDLVTVIVRQQRKFEADSELKTKKEFDVNSELDAFFKPTQGGLGAAGFRRGKPNVDYSFDQKLNGKADLTREDKLTTRLTARIIDIKPNGQLVLEGTARVEHDDEVSRITITGICRKEDVAADNTVLSTQVGELGIVVRNEGAVKSASTRGWLTKFLDAFKPF